MLSINNLSISFSGIPLFNDISFIINEKDRIGLVGKNGAGKTSLLRIIKGINEPDKGVVVIPKDFKIGFLPQELITNMKKNVLEETLYAFEDIIKLENKIKNYTDELSLRSDYHSDEYLAIINKLTEANELHNISGAATIYAETEKVLKGLGFTEQEFSRPVNEFSSGWQMRIELAKILLQKPQLILLDEPTNHLDIESIQWLEDYLINYNGAVIVVSHDRTFLDNITKRTIEISLGKIYDYEGNYSTYINMREERVELQLASYNNQQKEIEAIENFISRFRYKSTKARQVQSRIKKLEKMDIIKVEETDKAAIHFLFPPAPHSGKIVIEAKNISKSYNNKSILQDLNFIISKGEKIAFVGRNGEGKTTLTKIITSQIEHSGLLKLGHNVNIGYYAQNQSDLLNPDKTVFETIDDIAVGEIRKSIRAILGSFLFSGDTIDKKVKVLSGGEKARLALAKLLLAPVNLLILDEPTNHLDMLSKDILKNALIKYDGTLILVSHDRDFLCGLTDRIFEIKNKNIKEFIGDIFDFLENRKLQSLKSLESNSSLKITAIKDKQPSSEQLEREKRKIFERDLRRINKEIAKLEAFIELTENEISLIDKALANPDQFKDIINKPDIFQNYETLKSQLADSLLKWEKLHYELDTIQNP
ncbi:MAG: ABC-F family ATP-binding cassette domain-containing protein [Bacteroidales bacterium]|nr:ABC-F family ATP-binding cassette domain-containing protein [Bacteroidales bacterium]